MLKTLMLAVLPSVNQLRFTHSPLPLIKDVWDRRRCIHCLFLLNTVPTTLYPPPSATIMELLQFARIVRVVRIVTRIVRDLVMVMVVLIRTIAGTAVVPRRLVRALAVTQHGV